MAMKNISKAEVLTQKDQVSYQEGQVVSKTLAQNPFISVTLLAFDQGEEISTHESDGDAIVMPAKHPHAVFAEEKFKTMLVVVF